MPNKHSVHIAGHATSITLEDPFWQAFKKLAKEENCSVNTLVTKIDNERDTNLSSAIRLYVLNTLEKRLEEVHNENER